MALRKEQYARRGSGGNLGTGELTSVKAPLLGQRAPVEPNLRKELGRLCPLFLLIFVEVAALGLPIAILPIITTTEFARTRYFPDPVPIGSEIEAGSFGFVHNGLVTTPPLEGPTCVVGGSFGQATVAQIADNNGGVPPEAEECSAPPEGEQAIPGEFDSVPCCACVDPEDATTCFLSYPRLNCPTGLDGLCDEATTEEANTCEADNYFYYVNRDSCARGNGWAAAAVAYSDAGRNIITFAVSATIGAVADATGRRTILIIAEIVASLPNVVLWLWWILRDEMGVSAISIYVYYVVRGLSGFVNSIAVGVAYVADVTSEENRAVCIGILIAIAAIGIVSAPIGVLLPYGYAFAVSNILNAFTVVFTFFCIKESLEPEYRIPMEAARLNPLRTMSVLVRNKLFTLLTICILANSATNKGTTDINPFVLQRSFAFTSQDVGVLVVALGGAVIFTQVGLIKPLIGCIGERGVIIFGIACGLPLYVGIALFTPPVGPGTQWVAFTLIIIFGALSTLVFPATSSMESRNSGADEQGLVQGALFGAQSLAQAVGGITFSTLYAAIPEQGGAIAYGVAAIVQVIAVVAACMLPTGK